MSVITCGEFGELLAEPKRNNTRFAVTILRYNKLCLAGVLRFVGIIVLAVEHKH